LIAGFVPHAGCGLIQFTRALNSVTNSFGNLLLDYSLEYFTHSTKLALIKAIASLQQLLAFRQHVFHLYVHVL